MLLPEEQETCRCHIKSPLSWWDAVSEPHLQNLTSPMYPHKQPQGVSPLHSKACIPFGFFALFSWTPVNKSLLCYHFNSSWAGLYLQGPFTDFKRNCLHTGSWDGVESATTASLGDSCLQWSFTPATRKNRPCLQLLIPFCQLLQGINNKTLHILA